jgi:hypothetical protein
VDGGSRNLEISQHDGFILVGVSFVFSKGRRYNTWALAWTHHPESMPVKITKKDGH